MATCSNPGCGKPTKARGLCNKHYQTAKKTFSGEPCAHEGCGLVAYARGLCNKHWQAARMASPEARERKREDNALYRERHADVIRERQADAYWRDREQRITYMRARYAADPTRYVPSTEAWRKANPDKVKARNQARRARKKGAEGRYTAADWAAILLEHGHKCARCGAGGKLTVDHVIPLVQGGSNWPSNLQPLCLSCNCSKQDRAERWRDGRLVG